VAGESQRSRLSCFQVLLYYKFVSVPDTEATAAKQREWCEDLGLKGRIIVAPEGINGTCSGSAEATNEYMRRMSEDAEFKGTEFKLDLADAHAFKRFSVKVRSEIVTLGKEVDVPQFTATHLDAIEWDRRISKGDALILDIRNDYEYEIGHFEGAVRPPVETFKEFPSWLEANFSDAKDRPILTYCTGGIRCEKLTAFLAQEGFNDVYQLDGGIVTYAKHSTQSKFKGDCFVFDERMSVPVSGVVSICARCGNESSRYVNCSNVDCNRLYILCASCEASTGLACKDECHAASRQREANEKLSPELRGEGKRLRRARHRQRRKERAASA
jgi:UPF0176 protein